MIQINPLQRYIDGGARAAITTPPSASLVFDLPGRAIWVKGVKLKGTDHTYTFSHDNYISLTNTPGSNESEDIKIGINTTLLKQAIDTTYGIVNATTNGLAPMFSSANKATAAAATTYNFLGIAGTTLKWYSLPWRNVRINTETSDKLGVNDTDPLIISQGTGISVTWDSSGKKIVITNTAPDQNHNTDSNVAQTRTVQNKNYPLILKGSADDTGIIAGVNFNESITYNPSTLRLLINSSKVVTMADVYVGATASAAATSGLVPAATSALRTYFLRGDGTWATPQDYNTWRPIKVNSSEKLGSGTNTGAVDFVAGTGITLGWDATNKKITITNSAPDQNHNTDRTGIKLGNVSGNKKADGTVILANSASGLIIAGGTNKFSIGDGTNYIEVPIIISHGLSTKNITINGTAYAIYTSASSLPTFVAPGSYAGTGGYILATNSAKNGLEWVAKPTSNVTTTAIVGNSATATSQITAALTNPYYNLLEGGAVTRSIRFVAGNGITISAATDGLITITNSKPDVNHDTHYVTSMYIGESNDTKSNVVATNPYLKLFDNNTRRSTLRFVAGNGITIGSDASGNITITNSKPDVNHNTHYTTTMFAGENNDTKANKVATNPYLKLFDNDTRRSTLRFVAGTGITIASDANGNITVTNSAPDVNHNTDKTGLKKGAAGSTAASGLVIANSASGLIMEGGDKQFKVGDGTNAFTISFTVSSLDIIRSINGDTHAKALLTEFTNNKSSIPRNKLINYYSSAYGNGSQYFGYFLSGYDSNPYGGFFVAHYNACYYVGISNGTFTQWELSKVGHKHAYTDLTGSGTTANLAIMSNGTANGWKLATVSLSNHTHSLSIAADSGTSSISLAASTKYKLTAGGSTYIFTSTPDENVKQTNNDNNQNSPILLKNGTGTGQITSGTIFADGVTVNPSTNSLNVSGSNSYFLAIRGHRLGYRHLDAGPKSSWSDSRLYIGYNGFSDDDGVTDSIGFYRSTGTGTYTRTLWAEINSNGLYANTRFGVNGQNTGYNFYVNGSSYMNGSLLMNGNISFSNSGTGFRGINYGTMGDNDLWRIGGAATGSNAGYMEIATADDGNEPIYVRQYTGVFSKLKRTLTLLDGSGNSTFPGNIYIDTTDTDKFIQFRYDTNNYAGAAWRLISRGSGSGDTNYFDIETGGSNSGTNTWYRVIRLTMDSRRVGINTDSVEKTLDINGITQIYQRGNDNTAFKNLLLIKQQNSTEPSGDGWSASNPSFGIGFNRYWTSGSSPYGETTCAGIYATVSSSWRGGLVFRTKYNETSGGTPDITAMRLRPSGVAEFTRRIDAANLSNNAGYMNSAIQIREYGLGGALSDTWGNAPRLSWHWSGRVQAQIGLASNNHLYISENNFTNAYRIVMETGTWAINISGNAATATKLQTARNLQVNLASASAQSFDGSANATSIGVTGTLPFANLPTMYWANLSVQSSASNATVPSFGAIRMNGATSAGTNYITGAAGRIYFGGNFHIDSLGGNATYINHYTANNVYLVTGGGSVGIGTASPAHKLDVYSTSMIIGNSTGEAHIYARTSNFSNPALSFYDDTSGYGTMAVLGGGGCTVVGGGESAHEFAPNVRDENLYLTADANVNIFTNLDGGYSARRHVAQFTTGGDTYLYGNLYLGANASNNYIAFYGNTGDDPGSYATSFIGEHLWGGSESTELLLMKFNDVGNGTDGTTVSGAGPDRIRHVAHAHVFQIMTSTAQGSFETMATSTALETKFDIARYQLHMYAPLAVISDGTNSGYDGLAYFRHYSNNDWGIIIDKNNSYDYGLDIRASGSYSLRNAGGSRLIGSVMIGSDSVPSYTLDVNGNVYASGFRHSSVNSDSYVLLAGGGYKALGDFWHKDNSTVLVELHIDARGLNENTYYPVTISLVWGRSHIECYNHLSGHSKPSWSTHSSGFSVNVAWDTNPSGWGTIGVMRNIHTSAYAWSNAYPVGSIGQLTNSSLEYIYVRGGGFYYFRLTSGCSVTLHTSTYTIYGETVAPVSSVSWPEAQWGQSFYAPHFYESSDARLKHDISPISQSIRKFRFNDDNKLYYGFIAQELETLHPELVGSSGEYKTVNYNSAICYYIAELENKVQKLEDEINKLKNK